MVGSAPTVGDRFAPRHDSTSDPARDARLPLEQILDIAQEATTPHGMIFWPSGGTRVRHADFTSEDALIEQVLAACRDRSLPCLDLRLALRAVPSSEALAVDQFDTRPDELADRLAAAATAARPPRRDISGCSAAPARADTALRRRSQTL